MFSKEDMTLFLIAKEEMAQRPFPLLVFAWFRFLFPSLEVREGLRSGTLRLEGEVPLGGGTKALGP